MHGVGSAANSESCIQVQCRIGPRHILTPFRAHKGCAQLGHLLITNSIPKLQLLQEMQHISMMISKRLSIPLECRSDEDAVHIGIAVDPVDPS